jgi:hypothetical protein
MLTSEFAVFAEPGTATGPLTDTSHGDAGVAVDGVVDGGVGRLTLRGVSVVVGTTPLGGPWSAAAGVSTLTSVPVGWLPD